MATFAESIKEFINVSGLAAKIKALEAELSLLKKLRSGLGVKRRRFPARVAKTARRKRSRRGPRGKVKSTVIAYLHKNHKGKAGEIAKASGLKLGSVNQLLYSLKKDGTVTQAKLRGSPFVLAKK